MGEFGIGLKKIEWDGVGWIDLKEKVAGFCEHGNEPITKREDFLDWLRNCQLLKKDPAVWS